MKNIAVYPGSFDPITYGHIDVIERLQKLYTQVIVLVAHSSKKSSLFTVNERRQLIEASLQNLESVTVDDHDGLTVDYAQQAGAEVIIRGLRALSDFEYEYGMANMNKKLQPDVETLIMFTSPGYNYISSRLVREVASNQGDLEGIVPPPVAQALQAKMATKE